VGITMKLTRMDTSILQHTIQQQLENMDYYHGSLLCSVTDEG